MPKTGPTFRAPADIAKREASAIDKSDQSNNNKHHGIQSITGTLECAIMSDIKINVLFFASARELAGNVKSSDIYLKDGSDTAHLRKRLAEKYPKLASMVMNEDNCTLALNEEYIASGQVLNLKSGDTVALIPPISGG